MKEIAVKLIEFGQDFEYENWGSRGSKLVSYQLGIEVFIQDGKITMNYEGQRLLLDESEKSMNYIVCRIDEIILEATT